MVRALMRLEGMCVALLSVAGYFGLHLNWVVFLCFILVPDIAMLGYLVHPRVGAISYNLVHSYILPVGFLALGWLTHNLSLLQVGLIWTTHIGLDRMLGFGLKYPTAFRDTHLRRV